VVTKLEESWLDPLLGLPRLKSLRIEKLARLEKLPDLKSPTPVRCTYRS
jgi:hypothetical protein